MECWKLSLGHKHIWDYVVEVRIYESLEKKKLDLKKTNGMFIGYA